MSWYRPLVSLVAVLTAWLPPALLLLAAGLFCLIRPEHVTNWLRSFARPVGRASAVDISRAQKQARQATTRPIYIRLLGAVLSGVGLWILSRVLRFILSPQNTG